MLDIKKYEKLKKDMINKTIIANDKIKLENNFKNLLFNTHCILSSELSVLRFLSWNPQRRMNDIIIYFMSTDRLENIDHHDITVQYCTVQ